MLNFMSLISSYIIAITSEDFHVIQKEVVVVGRLNSLKISFLNVTVKYLNLLPIEQQSLQQNK